ncbi:MAG: hypothetical protein ACTSQF_01965 [Candidatus Heimdallarchaeaceae archaeon]
MNKQQNWLKDIINNGLFNDGEVSKAYTRKKSDKPSRNIRELSIVAFASKHGERLNNIIDKECDILGTEPSKAQLKELQKEIYSFIISNN